MMIFIVVGMPASGKNTARIYAESKRIRYFATGDIVREEVKKKGLEPSVENIAGVSDTMRGDDGMGVTRKALDAAFACGEPMVFMEGMRSWPEIEIIREKTAAVVVAFLAPRAIRLERIISRGRSDDSPEAFDERDRREIAYGTSVPIVLADEYVLNTGTIEDAIDDLDAVVDRYKER